MDFGIQDWLSGVDNLTALQRKGASAALSAPPEGKASLAAIELRGTRCGVVPLLLQGALSRSKPVLCVAFAAKGAGQQTFNALALTRLFGLHHKERRLAFGASLAEEETIKVSAERCTIAPSTAHRWRHLFLVALRPLDRLAEIMEVDETFLLESTGACGRWSTRPALAAARSAGLASRPAGAILVATDRGGSTMGYRLAAVNAANLKRVLAPVVRPMPYWSAPPTAVIRLWPEPSISPRERQCPSRREGPRPVGCPDGQQPP